MVEPDFLVDTVFFGGLAHIVQNLRPVGNRFCFGPRLERVTQREHVAVGADAGISEQIPGTAHAVAALENSKTLTGTFVLEMIASPDAGQPRADDQHVKMV